MVSVAFYGKNDHGKVTFRTVLVSCEFHSENAYFLYSLENDASRIKVVGAIKWKEKFLFLREIIVVLRKFERSENKDHVSFEANILINGRMEKRWEFSYVKNHPAVTGSVFVVPRVSVKSLEDPLKTFTFEVFDVKL